jgi:hypothetical protein
VETSVLWTKTRCLMEMPNDLIINSLQRVSSS